MNKLTQEEFIEKSRRIHGDKYSYDKLNYERNDVPITLICDVHGEFSILPRDHLKADCSCLATTGCKKCFLTRKAKTGTQTKFKRRVFSWDQYWFFQYTLYSNKEFEEEFVSVIKSRSFDKASDILLDKVKKDNPKISIKNIRGSMFHKNFVFDREKSSKITIKDWEDIRNCCYPNENDFLFKLKINTFNKKDIEKRNKKIALNLS